MGIAAPIATHNSFADLLINPRVPFATNSNHSLHHSAGDASPPISHKSPPTTHLCGKLMHCPKASCNSATSSTYPNLQQPQSALYSPCTMVDPYTTHAIPQTSASHSPSASYLAKRRQTHSQSAHQTPHHTSPTPNASTVHPPTPQTPGYTDILAPGGSVPLLNTNYLYNTLPHCQSHPDQLWHKPP